MAQLPERQLHEPVTATVAERMPRAVRLGLPLVGGLVMSGALYLIAVRGNVLLLDLATMTRTLLCL
jgi:hypothetical protein